MSEKIKKPQIIENSDQQPESETKRQQEPFSIQGFFRRWWMLLTVFTVVLALDQTAKTLVVNNLKLGESWVPIAAISDFIKVTRSFNRGAAFGIFPEAGDLILVIALATIVFFVINYPRLPASAWLSRLSIGLISGGAISNALDRLRFEHVVDYVHVQVTPTFANISNFADHAITVGVIMLMFDQWRIDDSEETSKESESEKTTSSDLPQVNTEETSL